MIGDARPAARHRLLRRHAGHRAVRAAGHRGAGARRASRRRFPGDEVVQQYGDAGRPADHDPAAAGRGRRSRAPASSRASQQIDEALQKAGLPKFERRQHARSSARSIGADLQRRGIYATLASLARASPSTSRSASASRSPSAPSPPRCTTCFVTLAFLTFFGYDLSLNVVAAILTITGYSVNDTIVIFDRVRENLRVDAPRAARAGRQH